MSVPMYITKAHALLAISKARRESNPPIVLVKKVEPVVTKSPCMKIHPKKHTTIVLAPTEFVGSMSSRNPKNFKWDHESYPNLQLKGSKKLGSFGKMIMGKFHLNKSELPKYCLCKWDNTEEHIKKLESEGHEVELFPDHKPSDEGEDGLYVGGYYSYITKEQLEKKKHTTHLKLVREAKKEYPDLDITKKNTFVEYASDISHSHSYDHDDRPFKVLYYQLYLEVA